MLLERHYEKLDAYYDLSTEERKEIKKIQDGGGSVILNRSRSYWMYIEGSSATMHMDSEFAEMLIEKGILVCIERVKDPDKRVATYKLEWMIPKTRYRS